MALDIIDTVRQQYKQAAEYDLPIFRIMVDGNDRTDVFKQRLIALRITDNRGLVADSLDIELSDTDNLLKIPPEMAEIQVWIGWQSTGLVYKGTFQVTGTSHSGPPDKISIAAEAADLADGFRQKREKSWHMLVLGDIIAQVAAQHDLIPLVHADLNDKEIAHIDQNESDANLITRLADDYDAIATVKNGHLLFMPRGVAQSASGLDLPIMYLRRNSGDGHAYRSGDGTDRIDGVKAFYYDNDKGLKKHIIVGIAEGGNLKEIRYTCRDKTSAELAANAEFNRSKRAAQALSLNLSRGHPNLIPEQQIIVEGFKRQIDEIIWLGTTVTHTLDANSGFTTSVECEVQLPDTDDLSQLFDGSIEREEIDYTKYTGVIAVYKDKTGKQQNFTLGDQTTPLTLKHTYETQYSAETAAYREYNRILESKDQPTVEKPKRTKTDISALTPSQRRKLRLSKYTGVKTWYKDKNGIEQPVTLGDQTKPLVKTQVYNSKKAAEDWAKKEYQKIQDAKK